MRSIIFSEEFCQPENLFPFHFTRQLQDIQVGILSIREKWEKTLNLPSFDKWEGTYKDGDRSMVIDPSIEPGNYLLLHANILPTDALVNAIKSLNPGEALMQEGAGAIALHFSAADVTGLHKIKVHKTLPFTGQFKAINRAWDIFQLNGEAITADIQMLCDGRSSHEVSPTNQVLGNGMLFIEEGVDMHACIINTNTGPVYIGKNASIMEGSCLRGPLAIGEGAVVKMGAKIYGGSSIGAYCIAGGEIKNAVMMPYSNKAHEGYLGDAVVGSWCNLGAGTSASNVKNNAGVVKVYHPHEPGGMAAVGNKCGLIMGDYSRCAINTSFNTGSVVGVSASVFGDGLLPKYIPNFAWGADGLRKYELTRALNDLSNWKKWKNQTLSKTEEHILKYIYENY